MRESTPFRLFAAALFTGSLVMTPYRTLEPHMQVRGIELLLFGWIAVPATLAWLANPLTIYSLSAMHKRHWSTVAASTLAVPLSLDFVNVETLGWDRSIDIEYGRIVAIQLGAYVWLASIVVTLMATIASVVEHRARANVQITKDAGAP